MTQTAQGRSAAPTLAMVREAWAEYLDRHQWDHFITLTTASQYTAATLERRITRGYLRRLERVAQRRIDWFLVLEATHHAPHLHAHALVSGTKALSVATLQRHWSVGHSRVTIVRPGPELGSYLAKTLHTNPDSWSSSRCFPPKRLT